MLFQVIEEKRIRQTSDNGSLGVLVDWVTEIAGEYEAMEVQGWSELAYVGECYEGEGFEVVRID